MTGKFFLRVVLAVLVSSPALAVTLDFEDLDPSPASYDLMPSPYNDFTFSGWFYGPDTLYTPASGSIDLFTDYADPSDPGAYIITNNNEIARATSFYFDGASFSGYSGVAFELWNSGTFLGTFGSLPDAPDIDPYGPTFLASGYGGLVDKVVVSGIQGYYSMDDFTYQEVAVVPEPASMFLMLVGLAGLVTVAHWQKKVF